MVGTCCDNSDYSSWDYEAAHRCPTCATLCDCQWGVADVRDCVHTCEEGA